jgi:hypothetical protein
MNIEREYADDGTEEAELWSDITKTRCVIEHHSSCCKSCEDELQDCSSSGEVY